MIQKMQTQISLAITNRILSPKGGLLLFLLSLFIFYFLVPLSAFSFSKPLDEYPLLSTLTLVSILSILIGYYTFKATSTSNLKPTGAPAKNAHLIPLNFHFVHGSIWAVFISFSIFTLITAPSIPFISALQGADAATLSEERGAFLKGREGGAIAILYLNTILTNTLVPYSMVSLFNERSKWRYVSAVLFFAYCISFMQKALFLNLALPLLAYMAHARRLNARVLFAALSLSIATLITATALSYSGSEPPSTSITDDYLTARHQPASAFDYVVWRALAVPIFTAVDTLVVHKEQFSAEPMLGATSSLLSLLFGIERINLERYVFEHQFGSWNETANSNAVFLTDAYVNFGWIGVFIFSIACGFAFALMQKTHDVGLRCLWPIFAFGLFSSSLIGTLFSNGFILVFFLSLLFKVNHRKS